MFVIVNWFHFEFNSYVLKGGSLDKYFIFKQLFTSYLGHRGLCCVIQFL
jgi:hypothetical protein